MFIKEKRYTLIHYLAGALPARLGDEMSNQVILLVALAVTGSIRSGSTVLAGLTVSAAIGGPLLGASLDRSKHPGRILASAIALYAIGLTAITCSIGRLPIWQVMGLALLVGFFMPAISGGWSSRLKSFVADEQMAHASAIDATTFNIAGLLGPGISGLIAASLGAYWAVAVLVALLVAALPMAWKLPRHIAQPEHTTSFAYDVASGFRIILKNKALLRITLVSVISYAGIGMLWVIYPLIGKELLGKAGYGGILASVLSVGALVATVAYAKLPTEYGPDAIALVSTLILAVAMGILLFAHMAWIAFTAMLVAGIADGPQLAAIFAVRHREASERLRSQVFTTGASLKITAAVGAEIAGIIASRSLTVTIVVAGLIQTIAAIAFLSCIV